MVSAVNPEVIARLHPEGAPPEVVATLADVRAPVAPRRDTSCRFCGGICALDVARNERNRDAA